MRPKDEDLAEAATILIAVGDGVLANSLRFSLELEGYAVKLCDEYSLLRAIAASEAPGLSGSRSGCVRADGGSPVRCDSASRSFSWWNAKTGRVLARAEAAGVTKVVEKPLLGKVLFEAIKTAMSKSPPSARDHRRSE